MKIIQKLKLSIVDTKLGHNIAGIGPRKDNKIVIFKILSLLNKRAKINI